MKIVAAIICCLTLSAPAWAQGDPAMESRLAAFATRDGFARLVAFEKFEKEVPSASRAEALVALWDAADGRKDRDLVRNSLLSYVTAKSLTDLPWTDPLKQMVKAASHDKSAVIRAGALPAIVKRGASTEMRAEIVGLLDDPERAVRDRAIDEVARWPDHAKLLQGYVQRNQGKKGHTETVERAKFLIKKGGIK